MIERNLPTYNAGDEEATFDDDCGKTVDSEDQSSVETAILIPKLKKNDAPVKVWWDTRNHNEGGAPCACEATNLIAFITCNPDSTGKGGTARSGDGEYDGSSGLYLANYFD